MSTRAIIDYLHLWHAVDAVQLSDQPDRTVWRWTSNGEYTAKSAYLMLHRGSTPFPGHKLVWKSWAPLRIKIFLWLALKRSIGLGIGEEGMGWTLGNAATSATRLKKPLTTSSQLARSQEKYGSSSSRRWDGRYRKLQRRCCVGGGDFVPCSMAKEGLASTPSLGSCRGKSGKNGTRGAFVKPPPPSLKRCTSSRPRLIGGLKPEPED